ncbi:MAG TPA: isocitrate lyase/PEP mutase family protein [Thermodesulfovibrionales bacterium]|jgi:2-methylisocitrate lyase-like PEP mutase family enzyme|nr:isocitrate lyase/PEP mutase family protein [Thermodesulfovibrionales bacterium]
MELTYGSRLRETLAENGMIPFIGVYDTFSAAISARRFDGIFVSGFSFAASYYGMPDIGLISWSDIVGFVQRLRAILPRQHLLVDIDDGYADTEVACHVVSLLESAGASGIILEDQKRPKRCGHLNNKQILSLDEFLPKIEKVIATRKDMVVVARTDAHDLDEVVKRVRAFDEAGADWLLVDGVSRLDTVKAVRAHTSKPLVFNHITGGKSPSLSLTELKAQGISVVLYSTPCLFAAQASIEETIRALKSRDGLLPAGETKSVDLSACQALLEENLLKRTLL